MKTRRLLGGLIEVVGIGIVLMVADGSNHEIAARLFGVVLMFVGLIVGKLWEDTDKKPNQSQEGYSKSDDHNPYPEEIIKA